jgi:acetyl-CoA acyltransferase 2
MPMGITAENLGQKYKVTREDSDEYALKSQQRWRLGAEFICILCLQPLTFSSNLANNAGYFKAEIEPIMLKSKKGENSFEVDEHPRETTPEQIAKLPPVFKKDGLVNAANASVGQQSNCFNFYM